MGDLSCGKKFFTPLVEPGASTPPSCFQGGIKGGGGTPRVTRLGPETARLRPVFGPGSLPPSGRPPRPPWVTFWVGLGSHPSPVDDKLMPALCGSENRGRTTNILHENSENRGRTTNILHAAPSHIALFATSQYNPSKLKVACPEPSEELPSSIKPMSSR